MENTLTHSRLTELLSYDEATGIFRWRFTRQGVPGGIEAGSAYANGYRRIRIDNLPHPTHRLAIFYATGAMPVNDVDHIDGNPRNNALSNLRDVTHQVNQQNRVRPNRRKTGRSSQYLGVSWKKDRSRWAANIQGSNGKARFIGYFDTELEAHNAYVAEKRNNHEGNTL